MADQPLVDANGENQFHDALDHAQFYDNVGNFTALDSETALPDAYAPRLKLRLR